MRVSDEESPLSPTYSPSAIERLVQFCIAWRGPLLGLGILLGILAYFPSRQLTFDRAIENMFAPDDPLLPPYAQLKRTFGGNEIVLAVYSDPHLLTLGGMQRLRALSAKLRGVVGVSATLAVNDGPLGDAVITPLGKRYLELFEGYTIGRDRTTVGVACLLNPHSPEPRWRIVETMRSMVEAHDPTGMLVGEPVMVVDGFRYLEQDGFLLGVVSTGLLVLTIILCFRSLRWVLVPLAVVQLTLLTTQGVLVLSRLRLSMVSSMLTAIVTIVGIGTAIHLIVRFREHRAAGLQPRQALAVAATVLAPPIFWAIATDVAGFGSLLIAKVGPVQDFGLMMAIGSALVLVSLLLMVPGMALIGRVDADPQRAWGEGRLELGLAKLATWIERHPRILWIASIAGSAVAAIGILRLEVETDFTRNFRATSPVVRSYKFVEEHLGGAGVWDVIVPAPTPIDAAFLARVRRLETRLRTEVHAGDGADSPRLTKVLSIADVLDASGLTAMGGMAIPLLSSRMPEFMGALVGIDPEDGQQYARIMLRSHERERAEVKQTLINQVTQIAAEEFPGAQGTGFFVLLTNLVESMTRDQWTTFALATCGIFFMVLLAFRSVWLALIALVPNALPIFVVTGLMGWLGLKINMGAAMIASVSMGLSVDSSMHYLTDFLNQRRAGRSVHQAIAAAHQNVGRAMVFSTLALVIGFSALCLSHFVPTIYFGALVGLTMLGGLAGNLIVLPLLLALTAPPHEDD
jgi:predicted RND superfamily exporter protein